MNEIKRILKTLFGYLIRPDLYPELGRKIIKNIFHRRNAFKGKKKTSEWVITRAQSQEDVIQKLFGRKMVQFSQQFKEIYNDALDIQEHCPVKMGGAGALELIYYASEFTEAKNIVETGVAYGWSSLCALLSLKNRDGALYSSDMPYLEQNGDSYVGCIVPENLRKYWKLFRHADKESLPKIFKDSNVFDVIHYDSDKSYDGRTWAYGQLYNHLRQGGVFISDDIGDNAAFQDFCNEKKINPEVIEFEGKYVGVFIK